MFLVLWLVDLLVLYIISCAIVSIYRKLKTINPLAPKLYVIFLFVLLTSILVLTYHSTSKLTSLTKISPYRCLEIRRNYCNMWQRCGDGGDEICKYFIEKLEKEFEECVKDWGFKPLKELRSKECGVTS